jgi:two-component system KDP operon response regulator KdpE
MPQSDKILIIDDEIQIRRFLRIAFDSQGYTVIEASTGKEGIYKAAMDKPDLIILDIGLPDMNGFEVLKEIRVWGQVPIIMLTIRDAEDDKITSLDNGANDYVTKPFSTGELLARIRASLRNRKTEADVHEFANGYLYVDTLSRTVKSQDAIVKLTSTEYELLLLLIKNAGRVLTHRHIMKEIWGPYRLDETQYLRVFMAQLRKKIEHEPKLIVTEPGVGYRMILMER